MKYTTLFLSTTTPTPTPTTTVITSNSIVHIFTSSYFFSNILILTEWAWILLYYQFTQTVRMVVHCPQVKWVTRSPILISRRQMVQVQHIWVIIIAADDDESVVARCCSLIRFCLSCISSCRRWCVIQRFMLGKQMWYWIFNCILQYLVDER